MLTGLAVDDAVMMMTVFWTTVESYVLSVRSEAAAEVAVIVFLVMQVRSIDSPFDSDSLSGLIVFYCFTLYC